jgi:hypothetical protein
VVSAPTRYRTVQLDERRTPGTRAPWLCTNADCDEARPGDERRPDHCPVHPDVSMMRGGPYVDLAARTGA